MHRFIQNIPDVKNFAKNLISEKVNFHCDTDFNDYITDSGEHCYTKEEAKFRNIKMQECFEVCEENHVDIYEIMGKYISDNLHLSLF